MGGGRSRFCVYVRGACNRLDAVLTSVTFKISLRQLEKRDRAIYNVQISKEFLISIKQLFGGSSHVYNSQVSFCFPM